MALLFSAVTVTAGEDEIELLVGGIPREYDDLEGWSEFDDLMYFISEETEVSVHAEAYLYGEGESMRASPEEINEMLLDYSDEEQKKLRPFFTSDHIYCLFDAFSQGLYNVARNGSPRYAGLLRQIASKCAILQDFDQQLFWRTFSGGVFHRRISVNSEPEKTDVWRFSTQFDFPYINENGELSRTVLMFEGVAESNFKDIANHSSECFSYSCYAAPLDANAKK